MKDEKNLHPVIFIFVLVSRKFMLAPLKIYLMLTTSPITPPNYDTLIKQLLIQQVATLQQDVNLDCHVIIDAEQKHFMLLKTGWEAIRRVCTPYLYVRLDNGKVWIEQDETCRQFAAQLQAVGVPSHDIVLGFHRPHIRRLTPYAES